MARILLADDDGTLRDLVKRAFETDGHVVDAVPDGQEALERLSTGIADVLVTDVNMPGLDGVSLAKQASVRMPDLRVLFMSGFPEELERAKSIGAARVGVLNKPFTLDQIKASLKMLMT